MRPDWRTALAQSAVLKRLAAFDPRVAGTPPLGLDLPDSDIDILCHAPDAAAFAGVVWEAFGDTPGFAMRQWARGDRAVIASFVLSGWEFELFGHPLPVAEQAGWRHFEVERRLLALGGAPFRMRVMDLRRAGLKTEPAFARALGLAGDPYAALLELSDQPDAALATHLNGR